MSGEKIKVKEGRGDIAPWTLWPGLSRMDRAMKQMTHEFLGHHGFDFGLPERLRQWDVGLREPAIEISEEKDDLVVKAELPGTKKENLEVDLSDHLLTIRGEKKNAEEIKEKGYFYSERSYGGFSRSIELPTDVRPEKARASFRDGVLEVRLPKTEEAKRREIRVRVD